MSAVEKQVIIIMFAMGIIGSLGYYIWYRRKQLASSRGQLSGQPSSKPLSNSVEPEVGPRHACLMDESPLEHGNDGSKNLSTVKLQENSDEKLPNSDNDARMTDTNLTGVAGEHKKSVRKKSASQPRRALDVYVPPPARPSHPEDSLTSKQPHPPLHPKKKSRSSSSLLTKPIEKVSVNKQPHPPAEPSYIVSIHIPLWLVSRFIGKQGCTIKSLKQFSGAELHVQRNTITESSHTSCNITGSEKQIEAALNLIKLHFPEVTLPNHPNMKLFHRPRHKPVSKMRQHSVYNGIPPAVIPSKTFLASISHINSLSSIWVYVVSNSSDPEPSPWEKLDKKMNSAYSFADACDSECSAVTITKGQFYAVRTAEDGFARGIVKEVHDGGRLYTIFLVDFGNCIIVDGNNLISLRY